MFYSLPRKSLPRDSKGFERIEGYFDHNSSMDESGKCCTGLHESMGSHYSVELVAVEE